MQKTAPHKLGDVYCKICVATPCPIVLPPSLRVNRWPTSRGMSLFRVSVNSMSSPGMTNSCPGEGKEGGREGDKERLRSCAHGRVGGRQERKREQNERGLEESRISRSVVSPHHLAALQQQQHVPFW